MTKANIIDKRVNVRVEKAVNESMDIYLNKLQTGYYDIGLEGAFQMHLGDIIGRELEQRTFFTDERFIIKFEKNMRINGNNDYVDIVIEYRRGNSTLEIYLIELKFKKKSQSAQDIGVIDSYIDIYNLECHHANTPNVCGCYFIFMTDDEVYTKASTRGTRMELPMHDGAMIVNNRTYTVSGKAAKGAMGKYPNGFTFKNSYTFNYQESEEDIKGVPHWHYILKI